MKTQKKSRLIFWREDVGYLIIRFFKKNLRDELFHDVESAQPRFKTHFRSSTGGYSKSQSATLLKRQTFETNWSRGWVELLEKVATLLRPGVVLA